MIEVKIFGEDPASREHGVVKMGNGLLISATGYVEKVFDGMLAYPTLVGPPESPQAVAFSFKNENGRDILTDISSVADHITEDEWGKLERGLIELRKQLSGQNSQTAIIAKSFQLPHKEKEREFYRRCFDPATGEERLVVMWGVFSNAPGNVVTKRVAAAPDSKIDEWRNGVPTIIPGKIKVDIDDSSGLSESLGIHEGEALSSDLGSHEKTEQLTSQRDDFLSSRWRTPAFIFLLLLLLGVLLFFLLKDPKGVEAEPYLAVNRETEDASEKPLNALPSEGAFNEDLEPEDVAPEELASEEPAPGSLVEDAVPEELVTDRVDPEQPIVNNPVRDTAPEKLSDSIARESLLSDQPAPGVPAEDAMPELLASERFEMPEQPSLENTSDSTMPEDVAPRELALEEAPSGFPPEDLMPEILVDEIEPEQPIENLFPEGLTSEEPMTELPSQGSMPEQLASEDVFSEQPFNETQKDGAIPDEAQASRVDSEEASSEFPPEDTLPEGLALQGAVPVTPPSDPSGECLISGGDALENQVSEKPSHAFRDELPGQEDLFTETDLEDAPSDEAWAGSGIHTSGSLNPRLDLSGYKMPIRHAWIPTTILDGLPTVWKGEDPPVFNTNKIVVVKFNHRVYDGDDRLIVSQIIEWVYKPQQSE